MHDLASTYAGRLLRLLIGAGAVVAIAGLLIEESPGSLPLQLSGITGGRALACLGGGLTMIAATTPAGRRIFDASDRP